MNEIRLLTRFTCESCGSIACRNAELWISLTIGGVDIIRDCGDYLVNIAVIQRATEEYGDGFPIVCICGDAGCAGFFTPAGFAHDATAVRWIFGSEAEIFFRDPGDSLVLDRDNLRNSVERAVEDLARLLSTTTECVFAFERNHSNRHYWASQLNAIESPNWHLKPHSPWRASKEQTP